MIDNSKEFWRAVLIRAGWTAAETALAMIPVGAKIQDVGWIDIASVAAVAAIISLLKSIVAGVPEVVR